MKAIILATCLFACSTGAMADVSASPLPAGEPAGVHQAQLSNGTGMIILAGAAAIGMGIALAVSNNHSGTPPVTSTSTTGTSP
jgi:hypothetical protein